jgi:hypothetical protein
MGLCRHSARIQDAECKIQDDDLLNSTNSHQHRRQCQRQRQHQRQLQLLSLMLILAAVPAADF